MIHRWVIHILAVVWWGPWEVGEAGWVMWIGMIALVTALLPASGPGWE